jgi:RNA polymerase sigma factor (sigma-70 family)
MYAEQIDERLTQLFESHYDDVLAYCARRVSREDADDIAAEVFAVAWRRIDDVQWETIRPWLFGVARNVMANRWRSLRRWSSLNRKVAGLANDYNDSPEILVLRREEDREILHSLQRLKASDQEVLRLAAWEELTAPEIAVTLGISTSAAEKRLQRALNRLTRIVDPAPEHVPGSPRAAEEGGS